MRILYLDLNFECIPGRTDEVLKKHGYTLLYVNTFHDALEMIRAQDFDAVVIAQNSFEVFDFIDKIQAIDREIPLFVADDWSTSELPLALEWCGGLRETETQLHA